MEYVIYIKTQSFDYNIWYLNGDTVKSVVASYLEGNTSFFIEGTKYWISNLFEIKIFNIESKEKTEEILTHYERQGVYISGRFTKGKVLALKFLKLHFEDVTSSFFPNHFDADKLEQKKKRKKRNTDFSSVFIIHGHDSAMLESTARFIERLEIKPIILHEQPNKGKTIIEKFEEYSNTAASICLLSPDDKCISADEESFRARQNVIFEMGYFIGKIGRENVISLFRQEVEIPSDYSGVIYIKYDKTSAWKLLLSKELKTIGFEIDLNKII